MLTAQIRVAFTGNRSVYGSPRIHVELTDAGVRVGRKRVARLMRAAQIVGCHRRKRSFSITGQDPKADVAPDRVDRKFIATRPNQLWVADFYVATWAGFVYVAFAIDLFSRAIVGWSIATVKDVTSVEACLKMALWRLDQYGRPIPAGMVHHSDAGSQEYTSHALERELRRHGALASMGSVADCFDNALAESVFATLECALLDQQPGGRFATHQQAKLAIFDFLEAFYNPRRRHSALGMRSPVAFEGPHATSARPDEQAAA